MTSVKLCTALSHFVEGFPTYAALLKDIKKEFETTLDRVIVFAHDNVQLRQQRSADKAARSEAVDKAYQKVLFSQLMYIHTLTKEFVYQAACTKRGRIRLLNH